MLTVFFDARLEAFGRRRRDPAPLHSRTPALVGNPPSLEILRLTFEGGKLRVDGE